VHVRDLRHRQVQHRDVIGGGVAASVAGRRMPARASRVPSRKQKIG
jgi:hypothetical protein